MNPSPAFSAANGTGSNLQAGNTASATWINKLKIVGRGQNWAVAPCEPFYLMGTEPPAPDAALTGAKNLIEHYGLENAYQKFCGKRLREELNAFLPHLSGNIDVPASVDESGLMSLIERPPIRGKELRPFAPSQLDHAFRLHPGPLPQEYASLFAAAPSKHIHRSVQDQQQLSGSNGTGTRVPATAVPGLSSSGSFHRRRRRHEVHRGALASGSDSSSSIGVPGVGGGNVSASPASFFTGPPTAYPQLGTVHTTTSLSSKPMLSQSHTLSSSLSITTSAPSTNVTMPNQSSTASDNNPVTQMVNHSKLVDHPPGLIPVSAPHSHLLGSSISTSSTSSEPPPPPLLAPIHHHSNQKLPHSIQNTSSTLNPLYNSNTSDASLTPSKSVPPAPPVLHSIHPPSINPINSSVPSQPPSSHQFYHHHHRHQQQQQQQLSSHLHHHQHPLSSMHHHHPITSSHSYPSSLSQNSSRSMSPIPMETNSSSPQSPDIYKIRRLDMTDEERRKKKRREKKRRKDKE
ncbi:unnamed protein product [Schistosoma curassoni]|uniref:Mediator of RNA polymerase II transcription subunit 19 n=1 Tax=Schistosoma curassoni TaxID=6186 RepID=A0A183KJY8_9TREM|nr:unnamed protein product [Schistosoma curassoni]VDP59043.1 unnamed protein product [Schistosoma curassoni]